MDKDEVISRNLENSDIRSLSRLQVYIQAASEEAHWTTFLSPLGNLHHLHW